jgi:anaerobic sulfite reductase subunit A
MECPRKGWDTCFCASMGSNIVQDNEFALGFGMDGDTVSLDVKNDIFDIYFSEKEAHTYHVPTVEENERSVEVPVIPNKEVLAKVKELQMWREFDRRCLACGACTVACSTCTCYTAYDMNYDIDTNAGERRRINASCHSDKFTDMAGGHKFREKVGDRMRYKVLHKVHDHKARFGEKESGGSDMCVGCGRCDERCPVLISFSTTVNKLAEECKQIVGEE